MKLIKAALALSAILATSAQANVISYTTDSSYNAATHGNTMVNFDGLNQGAYHYFGKSLTQDGVTFTEADARLFVIRGNYYSGYSGPTYLNNNDGGTTVGLSF